MKNKNKKEVRIYSVREGFHPKLTEKRFKSLYDRIHDAICFIGHVDYCPNCKKETRIYPNPFYGHTCEHCGWRGDYRDCLIKNDRDFVREILDDLLNEPI